MPIKLSFAPPHTSFAHSLFYYHSLLPQPTDYKRAFTCPPLRSHNPIYNIKHNIMKNLVTLTAIVALTSSVVTAKEDNYLQKLRKKNQRKLRRQQVEHIDSITTTTKKTLRNNKNKNKQNAAVGGLEEDVEFFTNMNRNLIGSIPMTDPPNPSPVIPPSGPPVIVDPTDPPVGGGGPTGGGTVTGPPVLVEAVVCVAGETCTEPGETCTDGTTEECCGDIFDSFTCECGSDLVFGNCGATNVCADIVCPPDNGGGTDPGVTPSPVPAPAAGFNCPAVSFQYFIFYYP